MQADGEADGGVEVTYWVIRNSKGLVLTGRMPTWRADCEPRKAVLNHPRDKEGRRRRRPEIFKRLKDAFKYACVGETITRVEIKEVGGQEYIVGRKEELK